MARPKSEKPENVEENLIKALLECFELADRPRQERTRLQRHTPILFLTAATVVLLLPFVNKAFHIDDPLFVWAAKNILSHPSNPYGFMVNWYGAEMPMAVVTKNPPLASYYIAVFASVLGWTEAALHLAFLLPAIGVIVGTYLLARKFCQLPIVAAIAALMTPVFLVSSTTVMSDTLMLAFWVFAVYLWIEGLGKNNHRMLAFGALLVALSSLTKYFGMTLIPLLLVYSFTKKRIPGLWLLHFLIPLTILAAYQWATQWLYGHGLLFDAAAYAADFGTWSLPKVLISFAFTGGCLAVVFFCTMQLWSKRVAVVGGALSVLLAFVISLLDKTLGQSPLPGDDTARWILALQLGLFAVSGVSLLAVSILDVCRRRDADAILLFLWIVGTSLFAGFVNWTTNGRSILPIVPATGIIIMRRIEQRASLTNREKRYKVFWPLVAAGVLSIAVTWADSSLANSHRTAAAIVRDRYNNAGRPVWFQGHWGFQYYMERVGARPLDIVRWNLAKGDLVVFPTTNTNLTPMNPEAATLRDAFEIPVNSWLATMNHYIGAGFYSDLWGPSPFAAGSVPPERFYVVEIQDPRALRR